MIMEHAELIEGQLINNDIDLDLINYIIQNTENKYAYI